MIQMKWPVVSRSQILKRLTFCLPLHWNKRYYGRSSHCLFLGGQKLIFMWFSILLSRKIIWCKLPNENLILGRAAEGRNTSILSWSSPSLHLRKWGTVFVPEAGWNISQDWESLLPSDDSSLSWNDNCHCRGPHYVACWCCYCCNCSDIVFWQYCNHHDSWSQTQEGGYRSYRTMEQNGGCSQGSLLCSWIQWWNITRWILAWSLPQKDSCWP